MGDPADARSLWWQHRRLEVELALPLPSSDGGGEAKVHAAMKLFAAGILLGVAAYIAFSYLVPAQPVARTPERSRPEGPSSPAPVGAPAMSPSAPVRLVSAPREVQTTDTSGAAVRATSAAAVRAC